MSLLEKQKLLARVARAMAKGDHSVVIKLCNDIIETDPRDVAVLSMKASAVEARGQSFEAAELWQSILIVDGNNFPALRRLTDHYRRVGDFERARLYAERAIKAHQPAKLSEGALRFVRAVGRLLGASQDMAIVASRDEDRLDADEARWLEEVRLFLEDSADSSN